MGDASISSFLEGSQDRTWPYPEKSIGRFICRKGYDSIWTAQGAARDTFETIAQEIKEFLDSSTEPISSWVTWSIYMIGRTPQNARPIIIFCCENRKHRRDIRAAIKQSGLLDNYPGIKTGDMPRPPDFAQLVSLANEVDLGYDTRLYLRSSPVARGARLVTIGSTDDEHVPWSAKSTIGGVIQVEDRYFYTTAAHPFRNGKGAPSQIGDSNNDTSGCKVMDDDCASFSFDEDSQPELQVEDDYLSLDEYSQSSAEAKDDSPSLYEYSWSEHEAEDDSPSIDQDLQSLHNIIDRASVEQKSYHEGHRTIMDEGTSTLVFRRGRPSFSDGSSKQNLTNMGMEQMLYFDYYEGVSFSTKESPVTGLDWALIEVTKPPHCTGNVRTLDRKRVVVNSVVTDVPYDTLVFASTTRGVKRGTLSATALYVQFPNSKGFRKMFAARLATELEKGDCGSWIVNEETGDLYGHIVAGTPGSGMALVAPFTDVFKDIEHHFGSIPMLPHSPFPPSRDPSHSVQCFLRTLNRLGNEKLRASMGTGKQGSANDSAGREEGQNTAREAKLAELVKMILEKRSDTTESLFTISSIAQFQDIMRLTRLSALEAKRSSTNGFVGNDGASKITWIGTRPVRLRRGTSLAVPYFKGDVIPIEPARLKTGAQEIHQSIMACWSAIAMWEDPEQQKKALAHIPYDTLLQDASEAQLEFRDTAMSSRGLIPPGPQDCLIYVILRWFRKHVFNLLHLPDCDPNRCPFRLEEPTAEEKMRGADHVEFYLCHHRYSARRISLYQPIDPLVLMERGWGSVLDWAICFGLLCRAVGSQARLIWNGTWYAWVEAYSASAQRWVSVDLLTGEWDMPQRCLDGWFGETTERRALVAKWEAFPRIPRPDDRHEVVRWVEQMSYCIALSNDGATDVTWRYLRHDLCRTRDYEEAVLHAIEQIRGDRRSTIPEEKKAQLRKEEDMERIQLYGHRVPRLLNRIETQYREEMDQEDQDSMYSMGSIDSVDSQDSQDSL